MPTPHSPHKILFVCLGNICRSPAAEIIFRKLADDAGRSAEFDIDSAGTIGYHQGKGPDERMAASLRKRGYPITGRSRLITPGDLQDFDRIVTMDESNLADVRTLDRNGEFHGKIRPLVSYCSMHDDPRVPDPYYGGQKGFDHVIDLLEDGCRGLLAEFPQ